MEATTTRITVEDKLRGIDATVERIHTYNHEVADDRRDRALAKLTRQREILKAVLDVHGNIVLPTHRDVAYTDTSHLLDDDMRWAVLWQYRRHLDLGSFVDLLIQTADVADNSNLDKLAKGYPALVNGIRRWRNERGWADEVRCLLADG